MARHNDGARHGNPASARIPGGSCRTTPAADHLLERGQKASSLGPKCTVPTSNAFEIPYRSGCWPRTRRPHSCSGHDPYYELPGLGLDGRNVDLVQIDAPFRSYLSSARALLRETRASKVLSGTGDRGRTACRPYLTPASVRASSGPVSACPWRRVRLGASCQRAVIPRARSRAWHRASRSFNCS